MATRLYLCHSTLLEWGTGVQPAFAGWQETGASSRKMMGLSPVGGGSDPLTDVVTSTTTPGNTTMHCQWISQPMAPGNTWTSGVSTFTAQIMGLESAINDNIINRVRRVAVYSRDGTTLRATLIALGNATSVVEWNTTLRNLTFLNATTVGATYTTVDGDRLVFEAGHDDSAGASIAGTLRRGSDAAGSGDLGINETDTTNTLRPWLETSVNIAFEPPYRPSIQTDYRHVLSH